MNILWVSLYPPLPLNFGGPVGIYKRLVELSKYNSIFLFYFDDEMNISYEQQLMKYCKEVHSYTKNSIKSLEIYKYGLYLPYTVITRINKKMQKDIQDCIERNNIDLINVEFPQMCINLLNIKKKYSIPLVLHEHNNEWNRFGQMGDAVSGIRRFIYKREAIFLFRLEKMLEKKGIIDYYSFLSCKDRDNFCLEFSVDKRRTFLVPLGADNSPLEIDEHCEKNIVFCAAMDSDLNVEGAKWFVNNVFNIIIEKIPNVFFYIVGRNPTEEIKKLESDKIKVTGTVKDIKEYYQLADLIVIPLLHGGGVKVKLLEAVGFNRNIVSTSIGIEGTEFNTRSQILVEDEATGFANACIKILCDKEYAEMLKNNTYQFFVKNYTWESIGKDYQSILVDIVKRERYEV